MTEELESVLHSKLITTARDYPGGIEQFQKKIIESGKNFELNLEKETTLGKMTDSIKRYNEKMCKDNPEKRIKNYKGDDITEDIDRFRRKDIENIRNWLIHPIHKDDGSKHRQLISKPEHVETKMIDTMILILDFMINEKLDEKESPTAKNT